MRIERSDKVPAAALIGFLLLCGGAKSMLAETAKAAKPRGGLGSVTTPREATRPPAATDSAPRALGRASAELAFGLACLERGIRRD